MVQVVKGRDIAENTVKSLAASQSSTDHHEGWRYFFEKSELRPGMDPEEATKRRQAALELRESQAGDFDSTNE